MDAAGGAGSRAGAGDAMVRVASHGGSLLVEVLMVEVSGFEWF